MFQIKTSRQTASWATRPYHHLSIFSETKCTMPPFRLTVPHPLFLLISARYVYETLVFRKKCRPAMKKKILTIQETQIINGWYTFSPQRPTNDLNTFFWGFFFQRGHKNIQNATVQNFQKRQFLYQVPLQYVTPQIVNRSRGLEVQVQRWSPITST